MSTRALAARLDRLTGGTAEARRLGREIIALAEELVERFGEDALAEVLPLVGMTPAGGEQ
jgi:hypothetical protein